MKKLFLILFSFIMIISAEEMSKKDFSLAITKDLSEIRELIDILSSIGMDINYKNPREKILSILKKDDLYLRRLNNEKLNNSLKTLGKRFENLNYSDHDALKKEILFIHALIKDYKTHLLIIKNGLYPNNKDVYFASVMASASKTLSAHYFMKRWKIKDPTIDKHWGKALLKIKKSIKHFENQNKFNLEISKIKKDLAFMEFSFKHKENYFILCLKRSNDIVDIALKMESSIISKL